MEGVFLLGRNGVTKIEGPRGETPACPEAKWQKGDVVEVRKLRGLMSGGERGAVAAVIPPGFSPDWAWADLHGRPRPLMHQVPHRVVSYILAMEGGRAILFKERYLKATGEKAEVVLGGSHAR